jgi:hypothetical protein
MFQQANGTSDAQTGHDATTVSVHDPALRGPDSGWSGLLRRWRGASSRPYRVGNCPACGLRIRDSVAAQLGFCDHCREFTGMCGAGRRIICPDVATRTTWHSPCTQLGVMAWEITLEHSECETVLCRAHDTQVRSGRMPWIVAAAPRGEPSGSGTRSPALRHP